MSSNKKFTFRNIRKFTFKNMNSYLKILVQINQIELIFYIHVFNMSSNISLKRFHANMSYMTSKGEYKKLYLNKTTGI